MTKFPCRCRRCGARKTLAMPPEHYEEGQEPKCLCGGRYRVDWFRKKTEHKRANCHCSGYPWSMSNGPHRRGSPDCYYKD